MSRKHFSWLLFVTFIVAALVLLVPGKTGRESGLENQSLMPGLTDRVNDIQWLQIAAAGDVTVATLKRQEDGWVVEEAGGYPADWPRLKKLLSDLSQAEIIEAKTSNPDYYARLGVEDIASESAAGSLVRFAADTGLPALIAGNTAQGRTGQYVRLANSAGSALIDRELDLAADLNGWLDRSIIDIPDAEVAEVSIRHADGEVVKISRVSTDDEHFQLQDVPEGREIQSEWTVDAPANALASLTLDAVAADTTLDWSGSARYSLLTADGLLIETELLGAGGEEDAADARYWLRLEAVLYRTAVEPDAESPEPVAATKERAGAINARTAGWAYQIPKYKYDAMVKRMEDFLKATDS